MALIPNTRDDERNEYYMRVLHKFFFLGEIEISLMKENKYAILDRIVWKKEK